MVVGNKPRNDLTSGLLENTPVDAHTCPIFILLIPLSRKDILYSHKQKNIYISYQQQQDFKPEYQSLKKVI